MLVKNTIVVSLCFAVLEAYSIHKEHNISLTQEIRGFQNKNISLPA